MAVSLTPPASLPAIDFSKLDLKLGSIEWDLVKFQVRKSLEEYGCFKALFDIPRELQKALFVETKELFDLPLSIKTLNVSTAPYRGYTGQTSALPLYESLGVDDPLNLEKVESFSAILWPQGKPNFSKTTQTFALQVSEFEKIIRRMVLESLGLENYLDEQMKTMTYHMRFSKYEGPQTSETKLALSPHADPNMITILHQNQVAGLELQNRGGEWMSADLSTNSFLVLLGQTFHAWTNGRFRAPYHRVVMTGEEARYSIGLFSSFPDGYMVTTPKELVSEEHPLLFKPFNYLEYLNFVQSNAGKGHQNLLQSFCGA